MIHFWLPEGPPADEVLDWDPDREPSRYASGAGHNVLELFARLAANGERVTLGRALPPGTRLVVLYAPAIEPLPLRKEALRVIRRARGRYALIRADAPVVFRLPVRPVRDFVPIQAAVTSAHQRWIPPLPQRGLRPRSPARRGAIRSVGYKGNPENVPPELREEGWREALAERGIAWLLDAPARTDGSDQQWHDFTETDVVLCMRNPAKRRDIARKPATRLLNAWRAGCIPLAEPEPGYVELARDGEDAFFVDGAESCLAVLDRLTADPSLLERTEQAVRARGVEFSPESVLARWRDALLEAVSAPESTGWRAALRTATAGAAQVRQVVRTR